ncbi:MAG TPA: chemotaxis protein CheX, partial [Candidatus Tectomicrobia bacterium]
MHTTWKEELFQAAVLTFEELCFLFPDSELQELQRHATVDVAVRVAFSGPFRGYLLIKVCGGLLPMLAANMLGQANAPPEEQQHDALGEVANVVCGNLLPRIAGAKEVFQL